ncbi:MAG: hypothetical protein ACE5EH_00445 [Gammaproteobacteria bacterium]
MVTTRKIRCRYGVTLLIAALSVSFDLFAQEEEKTWSIMPLLGVHGPQLSGLNNHEFKAPLPVTGSLVLQSEGSSFDVNFVVENELPKIEVGTEAGVEFNMRLDEKNIILLGASVWEGVATSVLETTLPFQGELSDVAYERSANISYMQYFLGWKRILIDRPKKYRIFSRVSLNEVFDVDLRERIVFAFQSGPAASFKRIVDMKSQATGVLMLQLGAGGEYFIRDWVSIGMNAGYTFGFRKIFLNNASLDTDFRDQDNLSLTLPQQLNSSNNIAYLAQYNPSTGSALYKELKLGFDGWRMLFHINIYY